MRVYLPNENISKVIGKNGEEISKIEQEMGLKIEIQPLHKIKKKAEGQAVNFEINLEEKNLLIYLDNSLKNSDVAIYGNEELLVQTKTSKKAVIRLSRNSIPGKAVERAVSLGSIKMVKI